jgi:peptide/nickel transport system ATP-binding protein
MRILPPRGKITAGKVWLAARNGAEPAGKEVKARPRQARRKPIELTTLHPNGDVIRQIRGGDISMIFQEPMTSFSPVHTIGDQIGECVRLHQKTNKKEARDRVIEMLRLVGIPMAEQRFSAYPHELSGGLRQRCMIAMALSCNPRLLVADEPTTALDVTIQAQILELIRRLQDELGMAVMMITHDLGVIAETAHEVAVMYLGRVVEQAVVAPIFEEPKHPYTRGLLRSIPRIGKGNVDRLAQIQGSVPDPFATVPGCPFHPRCEQCIQGVCTTGAPPEFVDVGNGHRVACHLYGPGREDVKGTTARTP